METINTDLPETTSILPSVEEQQQESTTITGEQPLLNDDQETEQAQSQARFAYAQTRQQRQTAKNAIRNNLNANEVALKNQEYEAPLVTPIKYSTPDEVKAKDTYTLVKDIIAQDDARAREEFYKWYPNLPQNKAADTLMTFREKVEAVGISHDRKVNNLDGVFDGTVDVIGPDMISSQGARFRMSSGGIYLDTSANRDSHLDRKAIADRLHKAESEVTDEDIQNYNNYRTYQLIKTLENGNSREFEVFDGKKVEYYKQYIAEHSKGIKVKLRKIADVSGSMYDKQGNGNISILSADGKYNLSDSFLLNPYLNLQYNMSTKHLYDYANAYISGALEMPKAPIDYRPHNWAEVIKTGANSLIDATVHSWMNIKAIYNRFKGDEQALKDYLIYKQLNPSYNFFRIPENVQLYRQVEMQKVIDKANQGGVWNTASAWLGSFFEAPAVAVSESLGEVGQMLIGARLGGGAATALGVTNKLGRYAFNLTGIALGAGLEETLNAEAEYLAKHGKPMSNNLFLGALVANSAALSLELPALMNLGAGFRRLIGIPGQISRKAVNTTLLAPIMNELKGYGLSIVNEAVTEPFQNATFQAWNDIESLSNISNYPRAWLGQWQGTNWGQRIYESGSAAGASAFQSGAGTNLSVLASARRAATQLMNGKMFDHNMDGTALDPDDIRLSNQRLRGFRDALRQKKEKLNAFFDPANIGQQGFTETDFQQALDDYIAAIDSLRVEQLAKDPSYTQDDMLDLGAMIDRATNLAIDTAISHAQENGSSLKDTCDYLYNAIIAKKPNGTPIPAGIDTVSEVYKKYQQTVFYSAPKSVLQVRKRHIEKELKDTDNAIEKAQLQQQLNDINEELNEEQVEVDFDGGTIVMSKERLERLEKFFHQLQEEGLISKEANFGDRLKNDLELFTFDADIFTNGQQGNSITEYTMRINSLYSDIALLRNAIVAAVQAINDKLPINQGINLQEVMLGKADLEALKVAHPELLTEINGLQGSQHQLGKCLDLLSQEVDALQDWVDKRQEKFFGFVNRILETFGNGNTNGKVEFSYYIFEKSDNPQLITLRFNGSSLKYGDITSSEPKIVNGQTSHPDALLLNRIYNENLKIEQFLSEVIDDIRQNVPELADNYKNYKNGIAATESLWDELVKLQTRIKNNDPKTRNRQIEAKFKGTVYDILSACIGKLMQDPRYAKYAMIFGKAVEDGTWLTKAQIHSMAEMNSRDPSNLTRFVFRALYQMMDDDAREKFKEALEEALNELIPMTELRDENDPYLQKYTSEQIADFLFLGPYKDRTANLLYNLKLQIQSVERAEAERETQATSEVTTADINESANTPQSMFYAMRSKLEQEGRFSELEYLDNNAEDIIHSIEEKGITRDNLESFLESTLRRYIPRELYIKVTSQTQSQDVLINDYLVPDRSSSKVLNKIIDEIENNPNASHTEKVVLYWLKRSILNSSEDMVLRRAGYATAMLLENLINSESTDKSIEKLRKYYAREIKKYKEDGVITKRVMKDNGKYTNVTFDYSTNRDKKAVFNKDKGCFEIDGEEVRFYGQRLGKEYEDVDAGNSLTPVITIDGREVTQVPQVLLAKPQTVESQPIEDTTSLSLLDKANDILKDLCEGISNDGTIAYSAGFLRGREREYNKFTIRERITKFQEYLAVLTNYVNDGGTDPRVLERLEQIKAGYLEIDGKKIPVPSIVEDIPQKDQVLTGEELRQYSKQYIIRSYTGTTENPFMPILDLGKQYKVVTVTAVPVSGAHTIVKNQDISQDADRNEYLAALNSQLAIDKKTNVRGEIIVVPVNSDGKSILPLFRPGEDANLKARVRASTHVQALHAPSLFSLDNQLRNEKTRTITDSEKDYLEKIKIGKRSGIRATLEYISKIGEMCSNDATFAAELARIIERVNDYTGVPTELAQLLSFLHELDRRIKSSNTTYRYYFFGHNYRGLEAEMAGLLKLFSDTKEYFPSQAYKNGEFINRSFVQNVFSMTLEKAYTVSQFYKDSKGYRANLAWFVTNRILRDFIIYSAKQNANGLNNAEWLQEIENIGINPDDVTTEPSNEFNFTYEGTTEEKGRKTEVIAMSILEDQGFAIEDSNVKVGNQEIDIVASGNDSKLHFIEVRSRGISETASNSIDSSKRGNIIEAVSKYSSEHNLKPSMYTIDTLTMDFVNDKVEVQYTKDVYQTDEQQDVLYSADFSTVSEESYEDRIRQHPEWQGEKDVVQIGEFRVVPFSKKGAQSFKSGAYILGIPNNITQQEKDRIAKITSYLEQQGLTVRTTSFFYEQEAQQGLSSQQTEVYTPDESAQNWSDKNYSAVTIGMRLANEKDDISNSDLQMITGVKTFLGRDLQTPADFILTYVDAETPQSKNITFATRLARKLDVPIFNLAMYDKIIGRFRKFIKNYIRSKGEQKAIYKPEVDGILEVSTKDKGIGKLFSAMNLKMEVDGKEVSVETAYQAGKRNDTDDNSREKAVLGMNGFEAKKYVKRNLTEYTRFVLNKTRLDRDIAYTCMYLAGLQYMMRKNPRYKDYLIQVFENYSGYKDTFRGLASKNNQADVLYKLRIMYKQDPEKFFRYLEEFNWKKGENNVIIKPFVEYFNKKRYLNSPNAFGYDHFFRFSPKQTGEDVISGDLASYDLPESTDEAMETLFETMYKGSGNVRNFSVLQGFLRPILEKRDNVNRQNIGWSTLVAAIAGSYKNTEHTYKEGHTIYNDIINGNYNDVSYILDHGTKSLEDSGTFYVAEKGYNIDRLASAFNGTSDFDIEPFVVGDVLFVADKYNNIYIIAQRKTVKATSLLAAMLLTNDTITDSQNYNLMRRTVMRMTNDISLDGKTIELTDDVVKSLAANLNNDIDITTDLLGLTAEYNNTQKAILDEKAQANKPKKINTEEETSEEYINEKLYEWHHFSVNDYSVSQLYNIYQNNEKERSLAYEFNMGDEFEQVQEKILSKINSQPIEEKDFYYNKFYQALDDLLYESDRAVSTQKTTNKQLETDRIREYFTSRIDSLGGVFQGSKTVPMRIDKEGDDVYAGLLNTNIVNKYIKFSNLEYKYRDDAIEKCVTLLNSLSQYTDITEKDISQNILGKAKQAFNESQPDLMHTPIFDFELQQIAKKVGIDSKIKNLSALDSKDLVRFLSELIEHIPALSLVYDFNITTDGSINAELDPVVITAIYKTALSQLCDYNNITSLTSDSAIAKVFNMSEEEFKSDENHDILKDTVLKVGVPFNTYLIRLGRMVADNLDMRIKKMDDNPVLLEDATYYSLGTMAFSIMQQINDKRLEMNFGDAYKLKIMERIMSKVYLGDPRDTANWSYSDMYNLMIKNKKEIESIPEEVISKEDIAYFYKDTSNLRPLFVKTPFNGKVFIKVYGYEKNEETSDRDTLQEMEQLFPDKTNVTGLSMQPITEIPTHNDSFARIVLTNEQKDAIATMQQTEVHIDDIAYKIYKKYNVSIYKLEGGRFDEDNVNLTAKERISNKNNSLNRASAILDCLYDIIKTDAFYTKYEVSKTMRFNCKGTVNPQGNKMHRWLTFPGQMRTLYFDGQSERSRNDLKYEAWALAQAFDRVKSKQKVQSCYDTLMQVCKDDRVDELERDICTLPAKEIEKKWDLGIEDVFQCISAVAHLRRRVEAMKEGKTSFETNLRAEIDSTTSGYFIKIMTLLDAKLVKRFGPKVGIHTQISNIITKIRAGKFVEDYSTMEELKAAINDIYRTVAEEMSKNNKAAVKATWENIQELSEDYHIEELFKNKKEFDEFVDTFPSAQLTIDGDWVVDSDLRELLKGVVMVYGYSAGESTLERKLSETFYFKYYGIANDLMRDFDARLDGKKPTLNDFREFYDNWKDKNPFLLKFFRLTNFYLDKFNEDDESYYNNLKARNPYHIKRLTSKKLTEEQDLQDFITYYAFYKLQVNGFSSNGEVIDVFPSAMIFKKTEHKTFSVESNICDILDNTLGAAMIKGMGAFGSISHSNMIMSTCSSIMNALAVKEFNERVSKLAELRSMSPAALMGTLTNKELNTLLRPDNKMYHASISNIFSMMSFANSLDNESLFNYDASKEDEYTRHYGLGVLEKEKTPNNEATQFFYALRNQPKTPNTTSQGSYFKQQMATSNVPIVSMGYKSDIGLELTAATTQGYDAGLLTQTINGLTELGVDGFFIHDAMVLPFNKISVGNYLYSRYASMNSAKYNMLLNYITQTLQALYKYYPNEVEKGLTGDYSYSESDNAFKEENKTESDVLTTLSLINLHNVFGFSKGVYNDNASFKYRYLISRFVGILKAFAETARINFERFYEQETDTVINNMGGLQLEEADYTINGKPSIEGPKTRALIANYNEIPVNHEYQLYEKVMDSILRRQSMKFFDTEELTEEPVEKSEVAEVKKEPQATKQESTAITNEQNWLFSFGCGIQTNNGWTEILSRANNMDSQAIMDVLDRLPKSIKDDPKAIAQFKNFLSQLDLSLLKGWSVQVGTTDEITQGATDFSNKIIYIAINNHDTSIMNPSPATVYMHEIMHGVLNYAFEARKTNPQINALIEKMRQVQEEASNLITWEDFLNDPAHATKEERMKAMALWDYCFANKQGNDAGLKEFISYANSDATFIKKLQGKKIPNSKISLFARIANLFKALVDVLSLKCTLTDIANQKQWFSNNTLDEYGGKDLFQAMQQLALDVQHANADARIHFNTITKAIYGFYGLVDALRKCGNQYLTKFTRTMFNLYKPMYFNMNTKAGIIKSLVMLPFSQQARNHWYDLISNTTRVLHVSDARLLLDDFSSIDDMRAKFDELSRNSRAVEAYYQNVMNITTESLTKAFGRELTQDESNALTDVVLCTDLQCLFDDIPNNIDEIVKIIKNENYREQLIQNLRTQPMTFKDVDVQENGGMQRRYKQRIKLSNKAQARIQKGIDEITTRWAYVLYHGKGDNFISTTDDVDSVVAMIKYNVLYQIVQQEFGYLDTKSVQAIATEIGNSMKDRINKLTTLKALSITQQRDANKMNLVSNLSKHGIEVFLSEHKGYVNNVKGQINFVEKQKERGKGFTLSRYNQNMQYVVAPMSEKDKMEYNGYVLVDNVHDNKNIYTEQGTHLEPKDGQPIGIFVKRELVINARSNSALTFIGTKWTGKDIESYLSEGVSLDQATSDKIVKEVEDLIQKGLVLPEVRDSLIAQKTENMKQQQARDVFFDYRDKQVLSAFNLNSPIKSEQQCEQSILDTAFDGRSYHPLTRQESVEKLKLSRNCFDILSRMVATQVAYNEGERQNASLMLQLKKFADDNMNPMTNRDKQSHKKFVDVTDRLVKELHLANLISQTHPNGRVWVREDMVEKLFGVTSTNLSQAKKKKGTRKGYSIYKPLVRGGFEIAEMLLKLLAYKDKETIVMRKPAVVLGNIISNISYNTLQEPNLKKVIDMNKANIANTNNYLRAQKEYQILELEARKNNGKLPYEKEARMIRLKQQMDNNPIAPLFESSMFTSIIEDVPLKDKEAVKGYFDMIATSKLGQKTPKIVKTMLKHLYMTEGTPVFDAFYNMNRYSDFVARATEYQILMEKRAEEIKKNPSKKADIQDEVMKEVWNAFIDYDRPNGKIEQYLNDMGILMFTKYAKGIQRVIVKQGIDNPMGVMMFLAREMAMPFDVSNIFEGNAFSRKWGMLIHNPVTSFIDVILPPLPRLVLGVL